MPYTFTRTGAQIEEIHDTVDDLTNIVSNENLISNSSFEIAGSVTNPPDATPRSYSAGDELFQGIFAVGALTGVTYIDGKANGTGQLYTDVYKSEKQKLSTANYVASIANSNGSPVEMGASFVDIGDHWRVTFDMNSTFSVKLEQGSVATGHSTTKSPVSFAGLFASVDKLKSGVSLGGGAISEQEVSLVDLAAETLGYYDGWAAYASPKGASRYLLSTIDRVRSSRSNPSWVPDGLGDHYLFGGSEFVAVLLARDSVLSLTSLGAKGDRVDDDTASVVNFFSRLTSEGLKGWVPAGDYITSSNIATSLDFTIEGVKGESIFRTKVDGVAFSFTTSPNRGSKILGVSWRNEDINLYPESIGIELKSPFGYGSRAVFEDCNFQNYNKYCFLTYANFNCRLINCNFTGSRASGKSWIDDGVYAVGYASWGADGTNTFADPSFSNMNILESCDFKNLYKAAEFINSTNTNWMRTGTIQNCNIGVTIWGYEDNPPAYKGRYSQPTICMDSVWMENVYQFTSSYDIDEATGAPLAVTDGLIPGVTYGEKPIFFGNTPGSPYANAAPTWKTLTRNQRYTANLYDGLGNRVTANEATSETDSRFTVSGGTVKVSAVIFDSRASRPIPDPSSPVYLLLPSGYKVQSENISQMVVEFSGWDGVSGIPVFVSETDVINGNNVAKLRTVSDSTGRPVDVTWGDINNQSTQLWRVNLEYSFVSSEDF